MSQKYRRSFGFTIVELLVVIVIIGVLTAVAMATYNNSQKKGADDKRTADIHSLASAIEVARQKENKTLYQITGDDCTGCKCRSSTYNTSLTEPRYLDKTAHTCWTTYKSFIDLIADKSGVDLAGLANGDPSGNPYHIDEREGDPSDDACDRDILASYLGSGVSIGAPQHYLPQFSPPGGCS